MALSKEEVSIRLGVDGKQVSTGLLSVRQQIEKFATSTTAKLRGILSANVFMSATTLVQQMLPTWDEIWSKIYGVDEEGTAKLQRATDNIRKIRDALKAAEVAQAKTARDQEFAGADNLGKTAILEGELDMAQRAKAAAAEALQFAEDHNLSLEDRKQRQIELTNATTDYMKALGALSDMQKKLTPAEVEKEFQRKLRATIPGVQRDRTDIGTINMEEAAGNMTPEMVAARRQALERIGTVVEARNVGALGQTANAFSQLPFGSGISKALEEAQTAAMRKTIIGVRIVDIEE